jgi:hypothetical protein
VARALVHRRGKGAARMSARGPCNNHLMNSSGEWAHSRGDYIEVDEHRVPIDAFGDRAPSEFFGVLGRIVAVNGQLEYFMDRLGHLPALETEGARKVEQFRARFMSGRDERNAVVHSRWVFGAQPSDPEVTLGVRYKVMKKPVGQVATVSIRDVPESEKDQIYVEHTLASLKRLLRRDLGTMQIGKQAYSEVMLAWAARQL